MTTAANAALIDRGGGLIYDDDRNITWLANANYGAGSSFDDGFSNSDGLMTWQSAIDWAAQLSYFDNVRGATYTDWRLAATPPAPDNTCTIPQPAFGTGCTGSELGHMFKLELGGTVTDPLGPNPAPGPGPFTNLQGDGYWSGTSFDATNAYVVNFGFSGQQAADNKALGYYAWAVRDGDVSAVPAPGALWLLGTGVLCLAGRVRGRARS
ncbi:MAG: PEP-CTERM sorting domain-containing protein [Gammaproteobacteria bacterium]|nr:PEP-CTERM sorting domain-containing protein [Gammaproteobacteria bacterium]